MSAGESLLVCAPGFPPRRGGAERWLGRVLAELAGRGHDVHVLTRSPEARPAPQGRHAPPTPTPGGVAVEGVRGGRPRFLRAVWDAVRSPGVGAVLCQFSALPAAVVAARDGRVPVVGVVHDVYGWAANWRLRGPLHGTMRRLGLETSVRRLPPDVLVAPSETTAARLGRLAPGVPVVVARPGSEPSARPAEPTGGDVLFVGRLVASKGVDDAISAVVALRPEHPEVRLLIVGAGPEQRRLQARAAQTRGAVVLTGPLPDAELDDAFARARVLVLPSRREGWGLTLTEAAAHGVPYLAYDTPAVNEQHRLLGGGLLVGRSVDALTEGLRQLLDDPGRATALGRAGWRACAALTWSDTADRVQEALSLARERAARRGR